MNRTFGAQTSQDDYLEAKHQNDLTKFIFRAVFSRSNHCMSVEFFLQNINMWIERMFETIFIYI